MVDIQSLINRVNVCILCIAKEGYAKRINTEKFFGDAIKIAATSAQDEEDVGVHVEGYSEDIFVANLVELRGALKKAQTDGAEGWSAFVNFFRENGGEKFSYMASLDIFAEQLENPTWALWTTEDNENEWSSNELRHSILSLFHDIHKAIKPPKPVGLDPA